jgi:arginase
MANDLNAGGWFLLGAPWDCSASGRGEAEAPRALRAAGLDVLVSTDLGDASIRIVNNSRDAETGILALHDTIRAAGVLADAMSRALHANPGSRPLVVGGDCSMLLGILPAVRQATGPMGLWFVDGHPDYQDGPSSGTGETADMDLALVTGDGPASLVGLAGDAPMVDAADTVLIGHRTGGLDDAANAELARVPQGMAQIPAPVVLHDPAAAGARAAGLLADTGAGSWLHLDLDVLDPRSMPAVTYPEPDGPDWDQLTALLLPLARSPRLLGVSVADFRPDLDPDGEHARRIVDLLVRVLP